VLSTPEIIEGVVEDIVEEVKEIPSAAPASVNSTIELIQLAQIVKDYGVNITVSVTSTGTEVKMSK
jgi:dihydrodipicolinate synthase/N-acetylneuraminate lyase